MVFLIIAACTVRNKTSLVIVELLMFFFTQNSGGDGGWVSWWLQGVAESTLSTTHIRLKISNLCVCVCV